jgi:predicted dehydrogenase
MQSIAESGSGVIAAIAEPAEDAAARAVEFVPDAEKVSGLDELLDCDLDGIVIATPSALHAEQSMRALERGIAVFCQKPLARTAAETKSVIDAARLADRLLGVDLSYRHTAGMQIIRRLVADGSLGTITSVELVFHNAYGPDKPWFYDRSLSGGGCVIDLGVHLIDLMLWSMDYPDCRVVSSALFANGSRLSAPVDRVEDFAVATVELATGCVVNLACSWKANAGQPAIISATFFGTTGGASFRNNGGSFYDFSAELFRGTQTELLAAPPDDWGGRAAIAWARRLAKSPAYDPEIEGVLASASLIDAVYGR